MLVLQTYSLLTSRIAYFAYIHVTTPALVHYICTMAIKSTCPQTLMKRALTLKYSLQVNDKRRLEKQLSIHFKSARILHLLIRISLSKILCRSDHYRADSSMFFFFSVVKLASVGVAKSILHQVTAALAVAEQELHFEHRFSRSISLS